MSEKTVQIVRSAPRKAEPKPLLPKFHGWRAAVQAPVVCVAMLLFLIGSAIALVGLVLVVASECALEWLCGGDKE